MSCDNSPIHYVSQTGGRWARDSTNINCLSSATTNTHSHPSMKIRTVTLLIGGGSEIIGNSFSKRVREFIEVCWSSSDWIDQHIDIDSSCNKLRIRMNELIVCGPNSTVQAQDQYWLSTWPNVFKSISKLVKYIKFIWVEAMHNNVISN